MALFDINYNTLINLVLPRRWRNNIMVAWLNVLAVPVVYVYNLFTVNRAANLYDLSITPQVALMEKVLNDTFDNTLRRIYITDTPTKDAIPIYTTLEEKPVALYTDAENEPLVLYTGAEVAESVDGFTVNVPTGLVFDMVYMRSEIDKYRLAGKTNYVIQTF